MSSFGLFKLRYIKSLFNQNKTEQIYKNKDPREQKPLSDHQMILLSEVRTRFSVWIEVNQIQTFVK